VRVAILLAFSAGAAAHAAVEAVLVKKVMDDKAIIVRANGEIHVIEKGVGCLSLWRFEGKRVYISSPGLFLGVGSRLLIPDADQQCRIWSSEPLGSEPVRPSYQPPRPSPLAPPSSAPDETVLAIQKALKILEYDVVTDGILTDKTIEAFSRYQSSKGHPRTEDGTRLSLLSLAVDVLNKRPVSPDGLAVATQLYRAAKSSSGRSSKEGCVEGHWVSSVTGGGELIKLEDGSIWEVDAADTVHSMLWLPTEEILICGQTLINTDNGEKVRAKRLR